jgi:hypothetical protein
MFKARSRRGLPISYLMKKHMSKAATDVQSAKRFPKPAMRDCALVIASTLLRGWQTRSRLTTSLQSAVREIPVERALRESSLELSCNAGMHGR